jgi:hypothetical protein
MIWGSFITLVLRKLRTSSIQDDIEIWGALGKEAAPFGRIFLPSKNLDQKALLPSPFPPRQPVILSPQKP